MIINCTQHPATPEQIAQGVVDLDPEDRAECARLLTFDELPTAEDLWVRADQLVELVKSSPASEPGCRVMIGGAPFFMAPLAHALVLAGFEPVFAFSRRDSVEQTQPDGSIRKTAVFRHMGFVVGL